MFCMKCGQENSDQADYCFKCGNRMPPRGDEFAPPPGIEDDPAIRWLLPIGRSGLAVAAGYLGLFSVLLVFAPFALLFGILALGDIKRNPKKLGKGRAIFGIIMGGLGTLGLIWLGILIVTH